MNSEKYAEVGGCPMEPPPTQTIPDQISPDPALTEQVSDAERPQPETEANAWRGELATRLNRYRSRRKAPPPRYPSLKLPFGATGASIESHPPADAPLTYDRASNQALALDGLRRQPSSTQPEAETRDRPTGPAIQIPAPPSAKIIEFPRSAWAPPPPPPDQLAEPVGEQLRILEVPEAVPPAPALGGITIEPIASAEPQKQPGIDCPLQPASLARRFIASALDGMIVAVASALFGFIFWKITAFRPPRLQLMGLGIGVLALLWAAYQYLMIVYSATTPGLRVAGLELAGFDGTAARRSTRRWRILASYLSAVSLGMGYAWVFLDEDALCWHDRITHTYLGPRKKQAKNLTP
jgi:uncharacterized RDD family membrane protein YckC